MATAATSSPTMATSYTYDPQTYRLASLSTVRGSDDANLQGGERTMPKG